jgi:hypothetical protein
MRQFGSYTLTMWANAPISPFLGFLNLLITQRLLGPTEPVGMSPSYLIRNAEENIEYVPDRREQRPDPPFLHSSTVAECTW